MPGGRGWGGGLLALERSRRSNSPSRAAPASSGSRSSSRSSSGGGADKVSLSRLTGILAAGWGFSNLSSLQYFPQYLSVGVIRPAPARRWKLEQVQRAAANVGRVQLALKKKTTVKWVFKTGDRCQLGYNNLMDKEEGC
ncbi:hypothetical protein T492DRAFT_832365 [Pavlovales sp. CCMP2436]|nr:hypothetical protein T492DRAFT_832365 [Pavlovales sp. CCMP2436]